MAEDVDTSLEGPLPMGQVQHRRLQVVQPVSEQAFRRIAMIFQGRSAVALCALLTNQMAPDERQAEQSNQFASVVSLSCCKMGGTKKATAVCYV